MASGFVQLLMKNRKFKNLIPLLAFGCCAFGLAACGSSDLVDYAPPVLAAPNRQCVIDREIQEVYITLVFSSDTLYNFDGESFNLSSVTAVNDTSLPFDFILDETDLQRFTIALYADATDYDFNLLPSTISSGYVNFSIDGSQSVLRVDFAGVTWSDWENEYFVFNYAVDDNFYTFAYSYTSIDAPRDVAGTIVEMLTYGIPGLGQGIASGVNAFINSLAFSNGALSPYFVVTIVFAGIALAVGLTRLIFNWLSDLGGSN